MKLTVVDIQKRVDAFPAKMNAKGIAKPSVNFRVNANESLSVDAHWYAGAHYTDFKSSHFKGDTPEDAISAFEAWIESLPSIEEARRAEFMSALASVIELGKGSGIEVDFVNPLVETMKRLSENAITDQRKAA
jgi:predicted RNase H-like HicB family nuclease